MKMEEVEETRGTLLLFAIFGLFMLLVSIYNEPEFLLENGEIYKEPALYEYSESSEIEFGIKYSYGYVHKIGSIYSDLESWQKDSILGMKRGDLVKLRINKNRIYQNKKEVLTSAINERVIYSLAQYEALKRREKEGMLAWTILFLGLYFIYTKSEWKETGCLVYLLAAIGMFAILVFWYL